MRVGCHLSTARGFEKAVEAALELNGNFFQYFPKNPRSYQLKAVDRAAGARGAQAAREADVWTVAHSPYVTNLATYDPKLHETTVASVINDLELTEALGTPWLVVHFGKHVGGGEEEGKRRMVETLDEILAGYRGSTLLCLENTAGQGSEMGRTPAEWMEIVEAVRQPERLGLCLDTCHAFAAGVVDWRDERSVAAFEAELRATGALPLIKVIHFNDSMVDFGGRRDRHQRLLKGYIGEEGLRRAATLPAFREIPLCLETPVDEEREYGPEIALLRRWKEAAGEAEAAGA
ncbi:MAG: deoxyribonuclease IV [Clostridia bacterium]|nr:deoxyribonuclease IV [Clostridia bacterium]MCL6522537.1 deoxyribonuclease IV [Bacillota bacterium]